MKIVSSRRRSEPRRSPSPTGARRRSIELGDPRQAACLFVYSAAMRRVRRGLLILLLLSPTLAACGSDSDAAPSGASGTTGAGGATTTSSTTGTTTGTGGAGGAGGGGPIGGDRPVDVHVPPSYQPGTPAPLVLLLHGYTASGDLEELYLHVTAESDKRGFLYAHP